MAPRQPSAAAWYSPALDSPNVSETSLDRVRRMVAAQGIDGAKVFKVGSAPPEGQGSTFYPLFVSAIATTWCLPSPSSSSLSSATTSYRLYISTPTPSFTWQSSPITVRLT